VGTLSVGGRKARGNSPAQLSIEDKARDECSHGWKSTADEDMHPSLLLMARRDRHEPKLKFKGVR